MVRGMFHISAPRKLQHAFYPAATVCIRASGRWKGDKTSFSLQLVSYPDFVFLFVYCVCCPRFCPSTRCLGRPPHTAQHRPLWHCSDLSAGDFIMKRRRFSFPQRKTRLWLTPPGLLGMLKGLSPAVEQQLPLAAALFPSPAAPAGAAAAAAAAVSAVPRSGSFTCRTWCVKEQTPHCSCSCTASSCSTAADARVARLQACRRRGRQGREGGGGVRHAAPSASRKRWRSAR